MSSGSSGLTPGGATACALIFAVADAACIVVNEAVILCP
jgi:hypothetical protein